MRKTIDAAPARGVLVALIGVLLVCAGPAVAEAKSKQQGARVEAQLIARGAGYGEPQGSQRVRTLQRRLRRAGERPGAIDGRFGPLTEAAVRSFQRRQGLAADGLVGEHTRAALARRLARLAPERPARAGLPERPTPATGQESRQTREPAPTPAGKSKPAVSPGDSDPEHPVRRVMLAMAGMLALVLAGAILLSRGRAAKPQHAAAAVDHDLRKIWLRAHPASASAARAFVAQAAEELHYDRAATRAMRLGITEAVANAVEHGVPCNRGLISVSVYLEDGCLITEVGDCGDFRATREATNGGLDERGRGLLLMFAMMDHVEIDTVPGRTVVRLVKRLPGSAGVEPEFLNVGERPAREGEP